MISNSLARRPLEPPSLAMPNPGPKWMRPEEPPVNSYRYWYLTPKNSDLELLIIRRPISARLEPQ